MACAGQTTEGLSLSLFPDSICNHPLQHSFLHLILLYSRDLLPTLYSPYSFVSTLNAANLIMAGISPSVSKGGGIKLPTASDCRSS